VLSPERRTGRELAATLVERALSVCGLSVGQLAMALGVGKERARDMLDPDVAGVGLGDVVVMQRRLPSAYREIVRQLGELDSAARGPGLSPLAHVARLSEELGQAAGAITECLADGALDDDERARIDRKLADIETAAAARRDLRSDR
jgi:hypothetical protein